jgi:hypothetical protein
MLFEVLLELYALNNYEWKMFRKWAVDKIESHKLGSCYIVYSLKATKCIVVVYTELHLVIATKRNLTSIGINL